MALIQFECRSCGEIFWLHIVTAEGRPIRPPLCKTCRSKDLEQISPRKRPELHPDPVDPRGNLQS